LFEGIATPLQIELMSTKEVLLEVAENLPPDASIGDAIHELELRTLAAGSNHFAQPGLDPRRALQTLQQQSHITSDEAARFLGEIRKERLRERGSAEP
jgi:hypothetical protein